MTCLLHDAPRPARPRRKPRSAFAPERMPPLDLCNGCGRQHFTTVDCICLGCVQHVLRQRRSQFPRSEGDVYMARRFGVSNYFREAGDGTN